MWGLLCDLADLAVLNCYYFDGNVFFLNYSVWHSSVHLCSVSSDALVVKELILLI